MKNLIMNLDYEVKVFIENWREGDSRVHDISLAKFGIVDSLTEEQLEYISSKINHVESVELDEDNILLITIHGTTLRKYFEDRLREWIEESDLRQFGRYESCGWI